MTIIDAYAGPGGWTQGLRALDLTDIGIERDAAACATRTAAGHRTIRADVAAFPLDHLVGHVDGLIMSPPCQAFSTAGTGAGRDVIPELADAIGRGDWAWSHDDDRVRHVLEVGRWAETLRPRWVACEQVPPVLPLWRAYADRWRARYGWSCWAGVLNAADVGVPQTRRRAFLIARTDGGVALPPAPTRCDGGALTFDGELLPWVTMADALGWGYDDRAARTLAGNRTARWLYSDADGTHGRMWPHERPATAVCGDPRLSPPGYRGRPDDYGPDGTYKGARSMDDAIRLTIRDALTLQGFPPDYPVQGTRTAQFRQVGDAVPPPLAAAVIGALTGARTRQAAA